MGGELKREDNILIYIYIYIYIYKSPTPKRIIYILYFKYIYRLVPALAVGFEDVKKRMEAQEKQAQAQMAILKETEDKINKLRNIDALATAKKLDEYKMRHMELTQRVIWVNIQ